MQKDTTRKLRQDLSPEQREQAERIGSLEFTSHRIVDTRGPQKFIPSKEQH